MKSLDIIRIGRFTFWVGIIKSKDENAAFWGNEDILNDFGVAESIDTPLRRE